MLTLTPIMPRKLAPQRDGSPPQPTHQPPAAFQIVDRITSGALRSASHESEYTYSYLEALTALKDAQTVVTVLPAGSDQAQEKSSDLSTMVDASIQFADNQSSFSVRGPILMQALDDVGILARGCKQDSEKVGVLQLLVDSALGRFEQPQWNQSCGVAMQALSDIRIIAQHRDPAISDNETALLASADQSAKKALSEAAKNSDAYQAGEILKSGLLNLKSSLTPTPIPPKE